MCEYPTSGGRAGLLTIVDANTFKDKLEIADELTRILFAITKIVPSQNIKDRLETSIRGNTTVGSRP